MRIRYIFGLLVTLMLTACSVDVELEEKVLPEVDENGNPVKVKENKSEQTCSVVFDTDNTITIK